MTAPADPRKLADTVREAKKWRELVNQWTDACEDVYDAAKEAGDEYPALLWQLADRGHSVGAEFGFALDRLDALVSLAEQLRAERDEARKTRDAKYRDVEQAARELSVERAARESAEAALRAAQQESAELRAALTDELDNWNPERRPTIAAELRAAQARADELEKALTRLENATRILDVMLREPAFEGLTSAEDYRAYVQGAWLGVEEACDSARAVLAASPQASEKGAR